MCADDSGRRRPYREAHETQPVDVELLKPPVPLTQQLDRGRPVSIVPRRSCGVPLPDGYLVTQMRRQSRKLAPAPPLTGKYISPDQTSQQPVKTNATEENAEAMPLKQHKRLPPPPTGDSLAAGAKQVGSASKRANRLSGPPPSRSSRLGVPVGWEAGISSIEERTEHGSSTEHGYGSEAHLLSGRTAER